MAARKRWQVVLAATTVLGVSGAVTNRHCVQTPCCPGLPYCDYQYGQPLSPPVIAVSLPALTIDQRPPYSPGVAPAGLTVLPSPVIRERIKVFQLGQMLVPNNHCVLSRVVVTLHENGMWIVSMQAEQNPWMTGPRNEVSTPVHLRGAVSAIQPPIPQLPQETNGLKRNQFWVCVRCLGVAPLPENPAVIATAKPVLFQLPIAPFWVQRGVPYNFFDQHYLPAVRQFFDQVDRVEVEFRYR
jgi:hypothetical protein